MEEAKTFEQLRRKKEFKQYQEHYNNAKVYNITENGIEEIGMAKEIFKFKED